MGIHTPIDSHYRFGELYGIRKSYGNMNRSIVESNVEQNLFNMMMSHLVESGNLEKIERFAAKNARLSEFTAKNSIVEAISYMSQSTESMNIPRNVKRRVSQRIRDVIESRLNSICADEYKIPSFDNNIVEDNEDNRETYDYMSISEADSREIDELIKDVAAKRDILGNNEIIQSRKDSEFEKGLNYKEKEETKHNYSIRSIVIDSIAGNEHKTKLIPPTSIYSSQETAKEYLNSTFKNVVEGINSTLVDKCGFRVPEKEYIWLSSGRPTPFLRGEIAVDAEKIRNSISTGGSADGLGDFLNAYFGPYGKYKDYLYRADGTPRIEMSKAQNMSTIDREVNAISSYPIIRVYAEVISWDVINGEDVLREIAPNDFRETPIKFID